MRNIESELGFWKNFLINRGKSFENPIMLNDLLLPMLDGLGSAKIANIGSGAINLIGNYYDKCSIKVYSSDFLANEYNKIISDMELCLSPIEYQDMTSMTYPDEMFDIVYCSNALDHCDDPYKAIEEFIRICKTDGWIFLRHIWHEGKRRGYKGLHKWNIDIDKDDVIIWNRNREIEFSLSEFGQEFESYLQPYGRSTNLIISRARKKL